MIRRIWQILEMAIVLVLASPLVAMAQQAAAPAAKGVSAGLGLIGLGAGLAVAVPAMGCGIGQGRLVASAMESIGRNPNSTGQLFVPMIIGLAFVESLTLYGLVVAFFLLAKI